METSTMLDSFKVPIAIVFGIMLITFQIIDIYVNILPEIFMFIKWIKSIVPPDLGMFIRWTGSIISLLAATVGNQFKRFFRLLQDFYSGRWYNPLGGSNIVMISSSNHFRELADSPELSLRAVYSDIFGFKYTIAHSEIPLNPNEQASHRYRLFTTTIRNIGVAQLDTLRVYQQARIGPVMDSLLDSHPPSDGWYSISLALLMRNLATGMLGTYFWGNALCSEPDFHIAITDFYIDVIRSATFLPIVPSFAKGTAHKLLTCNGHAINTLFVRLRQVIEVSDSWNEDENLKSMTLLYNLIEQVRGSDYWTTDLLIQAIIGIWFAASHQPWMNLHFVVLELLRRPDYAQALKEEIRTHGDLENVARFPLLDSFLKECVRLNPLDRSEYSRLHHSLHAAFSKYVNLYSYQWPSVGRRFRLSNSRVTAQKSLKVPLPAYQRGTSCTTQRGTLVQMNSMVIALLVKDRARIREGRLLQTRAKIFPYGDLDQGSGKSTVV